MKRQIFRSSRRLVHWAVFVVSVAFFLGGASACGPDRVWADDVVVTVYPPDAAPAIQVTEAQVRALPARTITTIDPWDNKKRTYTGCLLLTFLEKLGFADFKTVRITAPNNYQAKIARLEIMRHKYILSYAMDGKDYSELGEDNKGPLAVAAKMEDVEPADRLRVKNNLVWWINKMYVN